MMMRAKWILPLVLVTILSSCFKDEPNKEMQLASGSWRIEKVTMQTNDSLGNEMSTSEVTSVGMLMLTHDDDFMYEGTYSYSYDGVALAGSSMNNWFYSCDIWGLGIDGKTFNLGSYDPSTGYTTHVVGFTVLKRKRKKMELQYVRVHPTTGHLDYIETWELVKGTH